MNIAAPFRSFGHKPLEFNRTAEKWRKCGPEIASLVVLGVCLAIAGCAGGTTSTPSGTPVSTTSAPTISAISPTSSLAGSPSFTLTVSGANFGAYSVVDFGGTAFAATLLSSTQLTAVVPGSAVASAGTATVTVTNPVPSGGRSNAANFTINAKPSGQFTPTGNMTTARAEHTATLLPSGKVLIAGGDGAGLQPLASAELYDPSTGTFAPTGSMTTVRTWGHTATLLANGKVLIAAGSDRRDTYEPIAKAELYDPSTGIFTPTGSMITAQRTGPATLLADGKVLIAGEASAELYDPATGTFALTGAYADPTPILWRTATMLLDGTVLLTGCVGPCTAGATEVFDPKSGTFSRTGPMKGWINVNTATLLMNGKVLIVGNEENDGFLADAEVYDPAAGTFLSIGNAIEPHEYAAAVRLADGTVLITGGQLPGGSGSVGCDLYVPATGTFTFAGNMTMGRHEHTATLLADGTVLIAGGFSGWPTPTSSAEIYRH
jgi:large repetitive protein